VLQKQTTSPELLELLTKLMLDGFFQKFILVVGTSLALQIGHRNSVDINLFGQQEINKDVFEDRLNNYGITEISQSTKNILISSVNNIKVDFVNYNYPLLKPYKTIENVRLAFLEDIAAMKLNAIMGRGSKKDFIDLYFLLKKFSMKEIFDFYTDKYTNGSKFLVLKSLVYFTDADGQPQPKMYLDFNWEICKQKIIQEVLKL
jgi:hypothetical protein